MKIKLGAHVCGNVFLNEQLKEFNRVSVFFILVMASTVNAIATNTLEKDLMRLCTCTFPSPPV